MRFLQAKALKKSFLLDPRTTSRPNRVHNTPTKNQAQSRVLKDQAAIVQGRDHLAQAESNFPVISDAIAKAKATETNISHIKQWRMENQAHILQHWVEFSAIYWEIRKCTGKWIRGK